MTHANLPHPTREQLAEYLAGRIEEAVASTIELHLSQCNTCVDALAQLPPDEMLAKLRANSTELPGIAPAAPPDCPDVLRDHPRYRVLGLLGSGGMGAVYKAEHRLMERPVALKVISQRLTETPAAVERFHREVKGAARLSHPNIVAAYDADAAAGIHFLVMEYVEGATLAKLVAERGPIPASDACSYARQAAMGLQHAFECGMVHRDIKPQNLMLTPQGVVKILDFGLARFASEFGPTSVLTEYGVVMGTPDYIAPEQARDPHSADIRADIYSLGCTLYHLLAGHAPFAGAAFVQKLMCHLEQMPTPLTEIRSGLPAEFSRIVERMMAKAPGDRYQTPVEVAAALARWTTASGEPGRTQPEVPAAAEPIVRSARPPSHVAEVAVRRNPFDVTDVHDPDGEDVKAFAAQVTLRGYTGDENAWQWCEHATEGSPDLLDGHWASRWIGGTSRGEWVSGVATVKTVGDRVYILYTDATDTFLIDARREGIFLLGRYTNLGDPADSTPWCGLIVDHERIDGQWTYGRWDLRRKLAPEQDRLTLSGHKGQVLCLAFSPDGRTLTTGSHDQAVKLWDVRSGNERRSLSGHTAAVRCVAFSPDGKTLASGGGYDRTIKLWDVATGAERRTLTGHAGVIYSVSFAPNGLTLASSSEDRTVKLWDVAGGRELRTLAGHIEPVRCVTFSPDGSTLATASNDYTVKLWDLISGHTRRTLTGHTDRIVSVAFSPDGTSLVSGGNDQTIRVWDLATGAERSRLAGYAGVVFSIALSPDGRTLASASNTLELWDMSTGELRHTLRGHTAPIACVAFSPDGQTLASGSVDYTVILWNLQRLDRGPD